MNYTHWKCWASSKLSNATLLCDQVYKYKHKHKYKYKYKYKYMIAVKDWVGSGIVQMIVKCLPWAVQLSPFKCSSGTSTEIIANDQKVKGNAGKAEEKEKRKKQRMENTKTQQERKY